VHAAVTAPAAAPRLLVGVPRGEFLSCLLFSCPFLSPFLEARDRLEATVPTAGGSLPSPDPRPCGAGGTAGGRGRSTLPRDLVQMVGASLLFLDLSTLSSLSAPRMRAPAAATGHSTPPRELVQMVGAALLSIDLSALPSPPAPRMFVCYR